MTNQKTHCKRGHEFTKENTLVGNDGHKRCKECKKLTNKILYEKDPESHYKKTRQWALDHPEETRQLGRDWDRKNQKKKTDYRREIWWKQYPEKLKTEVLTYYGNGILQCMCCKEAILVFLTLDHIDGRKDFEKNNPRFGGWQLYQLVRSQGYPKGYETLCWNCNSGRATNSGVCPHKTNEINRPKYKARIDNPSKSALYQRTYLPKYIEKLRHECLTYYGGNKLGCVCCGIDKIQFLNIDHINGRTEEDKKNGKKRGWQLMRWLRANNYPEGYQTLCWNCNSGRQLNKGVCPHKEVNNKNSKEFT